MSAASLPGLIKGVTFRYLELPMTRATFLPSALTTGGIASANIEKDAIARRASHRFGLLQEFLMPQFSFEDPKECSIAPFYKHVEEMNISSLEERERIAARTQGH
jgi:hypothetical protein